MLLSKRYGQNRFFGIRNNLNHHFLVIIFLNMNQADLPEIDINEIMKNIRVEVEKRKSLSKYKTGKLKETVQQEIFESSTCLSEKVTKVDEGHLESLVSNRAQSVDELCQYHDIEFVTNAYRAILKREPGSNEINIWLPRLRTGELSKMEILAGLRFGSEGRRKKAAVKGLFFPFVLHRSFSIPFAGNVLRIFSCFLRLPSLFRNIRGLEYSINTRFEQVATSVKKIDGKVTSLQSAISTKVGGSEINRILNNLEALESRLSATLQATDSRLNVALQATDSRLNVALQATYSKLYDLIQKTKNTFHEPLVKINADLSDVTRQIRDYKFNVLAQQRRLDELLIHKSNEKQWGGVPKKLETRVTGSDHVLEAMYVAFEDQFRGTREEIKNRQRVYLPYVEKVLQETGHAGILDVGCGRGEWLELLVERGYSAKGVDLNRIMVTQSRELGLDVEKGDAFDYFLNIEPDSLSVVTGFHIVEHLPLETMISLFDQAFRVLKPGGMVIFETPNPENLIVGSCNFYYDPTHKNPIPPVTLRFLLEARGYQELEILRLHENAFYADLKQTDISEKVASLFFGAQDYSVIGYKT